MRTLRLWMMITLGLATVTATIHTAKACACCAEPGERYERVEQLDDYTRDVLKEVHFAASARLYTTAADWSEQIKGITNPSQSADYRLKVKRDQKTLTFELSDKNGSKGRLTLVLPGRVHKFHADTAPDPNDGQSYRPTTLYKEWRLAGSLTGDGMFTFAKSANARAQLILHGKGNGCTSSDQFTHWTLDATGTGVQFRFFGRLQKTR